MEGSRILVVDDEVNLTKVLSMILRMKGFRDIECRHDGNSALSALVDNHYSLMITDTHMPGLKGYEVIRHYKASPKANGTKFIGLSGLVDDTVEREYASLGVPLIKKPYHTNNLMDTVFRVMSE